MPALEPIPGIAPMIVPRKAPSRAARTFSHVSAMEKPIIRLERFSKLCYPLQEWALGRPLGAKDTVQHPLRDGHGQQLAEGPAEADGEGQTEGQAVVPALLPLGEEHHQTVEE